MNYKFNDFTIEQGDRLVSHTEMYEGDYLLSGHLIQTVQSMADKLIGHHKIVNCNES